MSVEETSVPGLPKFRMALVLVLFVSFPLATGCDLLDLLQSPPAEVTVNLNEVFQLFPGQTAHVRSEALAITFKEVLEDSRCPLYVECIWAGNAKVAIEIRQTGAEKQSLTLNSTLDPREVMYKEFRIRFEDLKPQPRFDRKILPNNYRLSLSVRKIAPH